LEVNRAFETLTGLEEVVGKKVSEVIPGLQKSDPELYEIYGRVARTGISESFEIFVQGLNRWFSISAYSPLKDHFVAVFDVVSDRKQAEQESKTDSERLAEMVAERTRELGAAQSQLVSQERLVTLGQLSGSIGHELRNPLGVISNAINFLQMAQAGASPKVKEYLGIIENETRNADKIITDLLNFTRVPTADRERVAVSDLVRQTLERFPVPATVEVTVRLPDRLPPLYVDRRQMTQVLGNLVVNSCQAMVSPAAGSSTDLPEGGRLFITAANKKDGLQIAVRDTGTGITPENMKLLFEPLFTTNAKGIGLGLAVSRKLVEANGGRIEVRSRVGRGSTFTLVFPDSKRLPKRRHCAYWSSTTIAA
jgi:signal transduction histidine kinase